MKGQAIKFTNFPPSKRTKEKNLRPKENILCGTVCPNFFYLEHMNILYIPFYTKYLSGMESNASVSWYIIKRQLEMIGE